MTPIMAAAPSAKPRITAIIAIISPVNVIIAAGAILCPLGQIVNERPKVTLGGAPPITRELELRRNRRGHCCKSVRLTWA
jgi:hypothetical protein